MSSPSEPRRAWIVALLLAAACTDPDAATTPEPDPETCAQSTLTYQNFAAPFVITWCRGCHGSGLPVNMRQNAPIGVDFDTAAEVRAAQNRILLRATGESPTMPPVGGPSAEERALLAEWLACGMK